MEDYGNGTPNLTVVSLKPPRGRGSSAVHPSTRTGVEGDKPPSLSRSKVDRHQVSFGSLDEGLSGQATRC